MQITPLRATAAWVAASAVVATAMTAASSATADITTAPAAVTAPAAAPAIGAPPPRGGWKQLSKGVFINTKVGNPDLIAKAGNARNGRNLGLHVTEDVTVHRILGNGNWNLIDISEDDKAVIPGTRVHDRGALMFLTTTQTDRAKTTNQGAWVYIDTDARINNRNRLIGADFPVPSPEPVMMWLYNELDSRVNVAPKAKPEMTTTLAAGPTKAGKSDNRLLIEQYREYTAGDWDLDFTVTPAGQSSIRIRANNPWIGYPKVVIDNYSVSLAAGDSCYVSWTGLYLVVSRSETEDFVKVLSVDLITPRDLKNYAVAPCSGSDVRGPY